MGAEFQVNTYTTSRQNYPEVAVSPDGDFVVVWHSPQLLYGSSGIFAQRFVGAATCTQGDPDGDGAGDLCDIGMTSPLNGDTLDCGDPATIRPTFMWTKGQYDQFKVFMGNSPGFEKGTRVTSGKKKITDTFWTPNKKKWKNACRKAVAAGPNMPVLYIQVRGKDRDLPKKDPGRIALSDLVQVDISP